MSASLAVDAHGNVLLRVVRCTEEQLEEAALHTSCPLALVVIVDENTKDVLFGLNRWHRSYELPGGMVEPGESFEAAAIREVDEETGIKIRSPELVGYAHFALVNPIREELGAVYYARRCGEDPVASDELSDFVWKRPLEATTVEISALDDAVAAWVIAAAG